MINIQDIIPFMKDGWVAMDAYGDWWWYNKKPVKNKSLLQWISYGDSVVYYCIDKAFDIAPADDWTQSLIQVKGVNDAK